MLFFATVFFILLALVFKFKFCLQYVKTLEYLDLNYRVWMCVDVCGCVWGVCAASVVVCVRRAVVVTDLC